MFRIIQSAGALTPFRMSYRDKTLIPPMALFALWFAFILAANGPIGTAKYRLPLEPLLNVLTAAGFCNLRSWRSKRATLSAPEPTTIATTPKICIVEHAARH